MSHCIQAQTLSQKMGGSLSDLRMRLTAVEDALEVVSFELEEQPKSLQLKRRQQNLKQAQHRLAKEIKVLGK